VPHAARLGECSQTASTPEVPFCAAARMAAPVVLARCSAAERGSVALQLGLAATTMRFRRERWLIRHQPLKPIPSESQQPLTGAAVTGSKSCSEGLSREFQSTVSSPFRQWRRNVEVGGSSPLTSTPLLFRQHLPCSLAISRVVSL
jgi:hypothetical protein